MFNGLRIFTWLILLTSFYQIDIFGVTAESLPPELISRGGLCVIIGGSDDLAMADKLFSSDPWVIHWLDARESKGKEARHTLQQRRLYGRILVEHWDKSILPYADNLVNLIIGNAQETMFDPDELFRVLAPEGEAFIVDSESFAPVAGGVLVHDGVAMAVAGRATFWF